MTLYHFCALKDSKHFNMHPYSELLPGVGLSSCKDEVSLGVILTGYVKSTLSFGVLFSSIEDNWQLGTTLFDSFFCQYINRSFLIMSNADVARDYS